MTENTLEQLSQFEQRASNYHIDYEFKAVDRTQKEEYNKLLKDGWLDARYVIDLSGIFYKDSIRYMLHSLDQYEGDIFYLLTRKKISSSPNIGF